MSTTPKKQLQWVQQKIHDLYPARECSRCKFLDPEDATCHVDHFFDWAARMKRRLEDR